MSVSYQGTAKAIETDEDRRSISYSVQGRQMQGVGSVSAAIQITCQAQSENTNLHIEAETTISGLAAQLGAGMIENIGNGILDDFCIALRGITDRQWPCYVRATASHSEIVEE